MVVQATHKTMVSIDIALVASWRFKVPITEDIIYLGHRTGTINDGSDLKTSFLWSSFHGSRE